MKQNKTKQSLLLATVIFKSGVSIDVAFPSERELFIFRKETQDKIADILYLNIKNSLTIEYSKKIGDYNV